MTFRRPATLLTVGVVVAACSSAPAPETTTTTQAAPAAADEPSVLTPVIAHAVTEPIPVPSTDGKTHLVYELALTNTLSQDATLTSLTVRAGDRTMLELPADRIGAWTRLSGTSSPTTVLGPAQSGYVWLDVIVPDGEPVPERLTHALGIAMRQPSPPLIPATLAEQIAPVGVRKRTPIVLRPPLTGPNWLDAVGCCGISGHRGALNPINGQIWAAERFAIDYVQLTPDGRLFTGASTDLAGFPSYGAEIHAVADGPVVSVTDGMPEAVPFAAPTGLALDQYPGNHVVQDLGNGNYALYAHLQTGSIAVKPGDRLSSGQVLARLGDTGNTDAPHLHFHVMSTPDPLRSDGLPFVFSSFDLQATLPDSEDALTAGRPAALPPPSSARPQRDVMPLQNDLMTYAVP